MYSVTYNIGVNLMYTLYMKSRATVIVASSSLKRGKLREGVRACDCDNRCVKKSAKKEADFFLENK